MAYRHLQFYTKEIELQVVEMVMRFYDYKHNYLYKFK